LVKFPGERNNLKMEDGGLKVSTPEPVEDDSPKIQGGNGQEKSGSHPLDEFLRGPLTPPSFPFQFNFFLSPSFPTNTLTHSVSEHQTGIIHNPYKIPPCLPPPYFTPTLRRISVKNILDSMKSRDGVKVFRQFQRGNRKYFLIF
jgi:hypothetical protein